MTNHVTDQSIDTLLTKLGTDDGFRTAFAADPGGALSAIGLAGLTTTVSLSGDEGLASKENFLAVRDELRASHSGYPFQPIHMDIQPSGALASKESFLAVRAELRASQIGAPFTPITLDLHPSASRAA